jgi:hypothetical protein
MSEANSQARLVEQLKAMIKRTEYVCQHNYDDGTECGTRLIAVGDLAAESNRAAVLLKELEAGGRKSAASKMPEPSTLASATCSTARPETPRTNAMLLKTFKGEVEHDGLATIVDLARQLERELDEMNHIAVSRHRQICRITAMWREDIEECDKLKERLAALSNDGAMPRRQTE